MPPSLWALSFLLLLGRAVAESLTFHLEQSWSVPTDESGAKLVFSDPGASLKALTVPIAVHAHLEEVATQHGADSMPHDQSQRVLSGSLPTNTVLTPNVTDRATLVNLAHAAWDAYHPMANDTDWYDIDGFAWRSRFGWNPGENGFRGHLFLSPDHKHGLIVVKGTSPGIFGIGVKKPEWGSETPDSTVVKDRLNDNLLFSCCCAHVPWRIELSHPCDCNAGEGNCCSSCLTDSLVEEDTYYSEAVTLVRFYRLRHPRTKFWLVGHSLGGAVAALAGLRFGLPTVTFEAPGDRLAATRLDLTTPAVSESAHRRSHDGGNRTIDQPIGHPKYITHVINNVDPLANGACTGATSVCAQAGYALEARCHVGNVIEYDLSKGRHGVILPIQAHRLEVVIGLLEDETVDIPAASPQINCQDCDGWQYGEFPIDRRGWWRRFWDGLFGRGHSERASQPYLQLW